MTTAYYVVGNGLGNIIQTTPAFNWLAQDHYSEVIVVAHPKDIDFAKVVYQDMARIETQVNRWGEGDIYRSSSPLHFKKGGGISEVELNLQRVQCHEDFMQPMKQSGFCGHSIMHEYFDVIICDGYNKRTNLTDWQVKSYPHWDKIAKRCIESGLAVASVGHPSEYISGTENRTGIGLKETLGLIKNAKVLLSNDTGFYHAACVLGTPCVVVFTMTDKDKNYDPVFHKLARVVSTDLPCQPCQLNEKAFWIKNKNNCGWACQNVPPEKIINALKEFL